MPTCICGTVFDKRLRKGDGFKNFCGQSCYLRAWRAANKARTKGYAAKRLAKARVVRESQMVVRVCLCGASFTAPRTRPGKPQKYCTVKCREIFRQRAWLAANPEKAAAIDARQDEKRRCNKAMNPERFKAYEAARYAANRDAQRARAKAYRAAIGKDRVNAATAAWRKANPEKQRAASKRWQAAHPEAVAHHIATWRARRRGNGGHHTLAEWRAKCAAYNHRCAYCCEEKPLTRDHDLPLSRGGTDDIANIIPACRLCNSKKRHRTAAEYLALTA